VIGELLRQAVANLKSDSLDIHISVSHEVHTGYDGDKVATYAAATTIRGVLMRKGQRIQWPTGHSVLESESLVLLGNVAVNQNDRITLPGGAKPPITEVKHVRDTTSTVLYTLVYFGRA
jgi:hypothetical protein